MPFKFQRLKRFLAELNAQALLKVLLIKLFLRKGKAIIAAVGRDNCVSSINFPDLFRIPLTSVRVMLFNKSAMSRFDFIERGSVR